MQKPDTVFVSFDQNPAIKEAMDGKKVGDEVTLEVHATIKEMAADGVNYTIEAVVPEGYELDEEAPAQDETKDSSAPASRTDALMTPAAMQVRKIQAKGKR